jgi:serine/threonine-protein kinase
MRDNSKAIPTGFSAADFVALLAGSGVISEMESRELQVRLNSWKDSDDALSLARQLVKEGTLTPFQARQLLRGKQGLVFGRYIVLDHIGQGARGWVFKARHSLMDRVVALKVVRTDVDLSERSVSRFFREMKIVGRLDHPNVVRALDADEQSGSPFIVMEYLEGENLEQVFARRGALPVDEVIDQMAQVARGLAHAHEKGVIHRDVKPTNLFLDKTGVVKILDLGFADLVGPAAQAGDAFDTDEGVVVGTTDFMSPELVKQEPVDARTDLFSLGCAMYRLLAGDYAFPGLTREDRLIKRIRERPVPIADVRPNLPRGVVNVVDRLLAIRPEDRFGSAAELAEALESFLPPASRRDWRSRGRTGPEASAPAIPPVHDEPESPPDWSLIESALRPDDIGPPRNASRLVDRHEPRSPSSKGLTSHRKSLEDEGIESGREAHEKYRNELIQMNRVMAELRSMEPKDETPEARGSWFERIGEKLGDSLSEPSAALILVGILAVILVLAFAIAMAIG